MSAHNSNDVVIVEKKRDIAVVTLNFPKRRNAFSLAMRTELYSQLYTLMHYDPDVRAIILTGAEGVFCAGGDISEMAKRTTLDYRERNLLPLNIFKLMVGGPKPIVAAVEGFAMGAGVSLAAACDYVVTTEKTRHACSFINVGLLPDCGLYWSLAQRVGAGKARKLMLTAKEFSGAEAHAIGFANEVVGGGEALAAALKIAKKYLKLSPLALAHTKAILATGSDTLEQTFSSEVNLQPLMMVSDDAVESVVATN